jgi:hypothetical protein
MSRSTSRCRGVSVDDDVGPEPLRGVDQCLPVAHSAHKVEILP